MITLNKTYNSACACCLKPMNTVHCKLCLVLMHLSMHACSVQNKMLRRMKLYKLQTFRYNFGLKNSNESHSTARIKPCCFHFLIISCTCCALAWLIGVLHVPS